MNFERFIQERFLGGTHDSEGQFTVDLRKASDKVAAFALPSDSHYLLKVVQVAHRLRTDEIRVDIGRFRTTLEFRPTGRQEFELERLYAALADPLGTEDPLLIDLVAALYGTLKTGLQEVTWEHQLGVQGQRLVVDRDRRVHCERYECELSDEPDRARFLFAVTHANPWMFWKGARHRAESAAVFLQFCRHSAAKIVLDGTDLVIASASEINSHVQRLSYEPGELTSSINFTEPASNILFELAGEDEAAFGISRPSLSAYLVRREVMNVWAQGMRVNNNLKPDGQSSAAWMLQFRRQGENISMRWARKRDRYSVVLGLNFKNAGSKEPPRFTIVRSGVTLVERAIKDPDLEEAFRGCHLLIADETMTTDLSGFQYVEDESFHRRLLSYAPLVAVARDYYEIGREMMNIPEKEKLTLDS